jgi:membrane-associated protease RseP (regulator of RpoE activity)
MEGVVAPEHATPSKELASALSTWPGRYYWQNAPEGRRLVLVRPIAEARERWWLHVLLFLLTFVTVSLAGVEWLSPGGLSLNPASLAAMGRGLPFSLPLLAILGAHELGHYALARRYGVDVSPPYFIPFPPSISIIGTLGAFIRIRSPIFDRRTLFDIGAAGPFAGLAIAVPVLVVGLALSNASPTTASSLLAHQFISIDGDPFYVGDSLLLAALRLVVGPSGVIELHPVAVAGWVGLFLTMLNLVPLAQFDGGHIVFALVGRRQVWLAWGFWVILLILGVAWHGWWVWAAIALALGRFSLSHPRLVSPLLPLDSKRVTLAWLSVALFVLCFTPIPFSLP